MKVLKVLGLINNIKSTKLIYNFFKDKCCWRKQSQEFRLKHTDEGRDNLIEKQSKMKWWVRSTKRLVRL